MKLEQNGKASIIDYNLPEPTSYPGRNFIELRFDPINIFNEKASSTSILGPGAQPLMMPVSSATRQVDSASVIEAMKSGFADRTIFPFMKLYSGLLKLVAKTDGTFELVGPTPISPKLAHIDPYEVTAMFQAGKRLVVYNSMYGPLTYGYIAEPITRPTVPLIAAQPISEPPEGPLVAIDSPQNGMTIQGPATGVDVDVLVRVEWDIPGFDNTKINRVQVTIGSNPPKTAALVVPGPSSTWKVHDTIKNAGPQKITAKVTSGRNSWTDSVQVRIAFNQGGPGDKTPPEIAITSPTEGSMYYGASTGVTIKVQGTAFDSDSGIQTVDVKIGNNPFQPAIPKVPGDWSTWSASNNVVVDGTQPITARATDQAGNAAQVVVRVTVAFIELRPRLYLIESVRLSSFLGNYGAGRTLRTFSLLPGEKTRISVKTFTKTEQEQKDSSSVLDSFTQESADDFKTSLDNEQSDKKKYDETFGYEVNAKASASWGWGSADVSAGVKGSTNSANEEFAKNVSNTTTSHAAKASAKRDVTINTSYEIKTESGQETSIERDIQNINVSRTLNFVFRQMNQQFITLLHLVDVRIAFWDGNSNPDGKRMEVPLPELDSLLKEYVNKTNWKDVTDAIVNQLTYIYDYDDNLHQDFIEKVSVSDAAGNIKKEFWRVRKKNNFSKYTDPVSKIDLTVRGIILAADDHVLRTEGVMVDAVLGQGDALDDYSHGLQDQAVKAKELENEEEQTEIDKNKLGIKIVTDDDANSAKLFAEVFPPEPEEEILLTPVPQVPGTTSSTVSSLRTRAARRRRTRSALHRPAD